MRPSFPIYREPPKAARLWARKPGFEYKQALDTGLVTFTTRTLLCHPQYIDKRASSVTIQFDCVSVPSMTDGELTDEYETGIIVAVSSLTPDACVHVHTFTSHDELTVHNKFMSELKPYDLLNSYFKPYVT